MDPNTALVTLLEAFQDEDDDAVIEHLANLHDWIFRGGFHPVIRTVETNTFTIGE